MSGSKGAKEIVSKFSAPDLGFTKLCKIEDIEALIDSHLEPLRQFLKHDSSCNSQAWCEEHRQYEATKDKCDCGLAELAEKWKPGGSSTEDTAR